MCNTMKFPICLYTNHLATSNPFQFEDNKIYTFFLNSSLLLSERILVQVSASQNSQCKKLTKIESRSGIIAVSKYLNLQAKSIRFWFKTLPSCF